MYWTTSDTIFEDFVSWDEALKSGAKRFKQTNANVYIFEIRNFHNINYPIYRVTNKESIVILDYQVAELIKTFRV